MKFLRRYLSLRYRLRARRWRVRALRAEARLADLQLKFDSEMYRNREREDTFVSATVMGTRGMFGVAPRTGPAMKQVKQIPADVSGVDANGFNAADRMEFDLYWKDAALAKGIPLQQAKQMYYEQEIVPRRTPLNDDPFGNAN